MKFAKLRNMQFFQSNLSVESAQGTQKWSLNTGGLLTQVKYS